MTDTAALFAENVVSIRCNQRDFIPSPTGDDLFHGDFPRSYKAKKLDHLLGRSEVASFSGQYSDFKPTFSPDGNSVYFSSNRLNENQQGGVVTQIWVGNRKGNIWGEPVKVNLPKVQKTHIFSTCIAKNGNLCFNATMDRGIGPEEIWMSRFINGQYTKPEVLGTAINSPLSEFNAFVCPDEEYINFTS